MAEQSRPKGSPARFGDRLIDGVVTMICWAYFTVGFIVFFSVRYAGAYLFSSEREYRFQYLNSRFYRFFFYLLRALTPRQRWQIGKEVEAIRSAVIICNHVSYLDPLLFISLFERQKTVVKTTFFKVPIFGWVLEHSGYFPADSSGIHARIMIEQVERMGSFLAAGGNFFIFPEGTRSRNGNIGTLNRGALKIARLCRAPIYVLHLANTDKLFTPGRFLFNTRTANTISLSLADRIDSGIIQGLTLIELEGKIRDALLSRAAAVRQRNTDQENPGDRKRPTTNV